MPVTRALGVIRLSELADDTTSPTRQREIITAAAATRGSEVVAWAEDLDISATKFPPTQRPELARWLQHPDAYDEVIFWRLDRFVRKPSDLTDMIRWAETNGKGLVSATESFDLHDPLGEAMAYLASIFAKMESAATSVRVSGAHEFLRRNLRWGGGRPPYGYRVIDNPAGNGKVLDIDPDTAEVVREAVRRVSDGQSVTSVAADFNARGIVPPQGRESKKGKKGRQETPLWNNTSLRVILRDKAMLGHVVHKGESVLGDDGMPLLRAEPLIELDEWTRLQAALDKMSQTHVRTDTPSLLLQVAFCSLCGAPLYRWAKYNYPKLADGTRAKYGPFNYYRCKGSFNTATARKDCNAKLIRIDDLDSRALEAVMEKYGQLPHTEPRVIPGDNHDLEIAAVNEAMTSLTSQLTREVITDDEYDAKMRSRRAERARLKALPAEPDRIEEVPTGQTNAEYLADLDIVGKRQWMIVHNITVSAHRDGDGELIVAVEEPDIRETEGRWEDLRHTYAEVLPEIVKSIKAGEAL
jgi:DNA invertase Pin-like site-specific DNA recombinase